MKVFLLRLLFFCLVLLSASQVWAEVFIYRAQRAAQGGDLAKSVHLLQQAPVWAQENPIWLEQFSTAALQLEEKRPLKEASEAIVKLTETLPNYGQGWRLKAKLHHRKEDWQKALSLEPGNLSLNIEYLLFELTHLPNIPVEELQAQLKNLRKLLRAPAEVDYSSYSTKPSPMLRPTLENLWNRYRRWSLLVQVTPEDLPSYQTLRDFAVDNNLWYERHLMNSKLLELESEAYDYYCKRAETYLEKKQYEIASHEFRKAFWTRNWSYLRAKKGILEAEKHLGIEHADKHPLWKQSTEETLRLVALEENPEIPEVTTTQIAPTSWYDEENQAPNLLKGRMTKTVALQAGKGRFFISARKIKNENSGAFLRFRLQGREMGSCYITSRTWQTCALEFETVGGNRWLEVALLNDELSGGIQLGEAQILQGKRR